MMITHYTVVEVEMESSASEQVIECNLFLNERNSSAEIMSFAAGEFPLPLFP